jgi:hypothetical protein
MLTVNVEEANRKMVKWIETRLADSASLLSVPGLISGSISSTTANKTERETCAYESFKDFAFAQERMIEETN